MLFDGRLDLSSEKLGLIAMAGFTACGWSSALEISPWTSEYICRPRHSFQTVWTKTVPNPRKGSQVRLGIRCSFSRSRNSGGEPESEAVHSVTCSSRSHLVSPSVASPSRLPAALCTMTSTAKTLQAPLVVVGSVNADIYVEIDRIPKEGETMAAKSGQTLPGGKGANQAACAARLNYPTYFVGQVGKDSFATLIRDALQTSGAKLDHLNTVAGPTGHAVVMLQPGGQNSIIIVGGSNVSWPRLDGGIGRLTEKAQQLVRRAGAVLLQREVPDTVNTEAAKIARSANVPVILDAGGAASPVPEELLKHVTIFSPNETELANLTGMETETTQNVIDAATKIMNLGVKQVLVKLGAKGSILLSKDEPPVFQPAILAPIAVDTTGAGDTFTAAYAVALIEGQKSIDALRFAAAAASLCIRTKGAIPSMPTRKSVLDLLQENPLDEVKEAKENAKEDVVTKT